MDPSPAPASGNHLLHEKSPYLLQHAHNPVDWYPWGEEAFAKARKEDKPIFLSVGYSTCHWCHVMAHESFENPATAAVMNRLFVNIKVDREERPDVDRMYMTFVQATTGSGGWPMSVWLTPNLKPIAGGTYFPPDDRYGRRGFASVCETIGQAWKDDRAKIIAQSDRILTALRDYAHPEPAAPTDAKANPVAELLRTGVHTLSASFDAEWGGFGTAPKFPRPVTLAFLALAQARLPGDDGAEAKRMLLTTLDRMASGGLHDHLGGGFHRYSVDRFWHVPHFEKMLYDQAQLAVAYLEAFQITGEERYAGRVRDTLEYVRRDMTSPGGGFFCAEDADSLLTAGKPEHAEGAFYVWTEAEINAALPPEEAAAFRAWFDVHPKGNAPEGSDPQGEFVDKNILFHATAGETLPAALADARRKLFDLRARRPRPHLDDKIVTAWNGLMISAFAKAYQVLGDDAFLQTATCAADFLRQNLYQADGGTLRRSYREGPGQVNGFADDYAFLIAGLLDLYEAGFNVDYLRWAEQLQAKQDELFYDREHGGYFSSGAHDPGVLIRFKEDNDGAEPSASSVSALNLLRLATLTEKDAFRQQAEKTVQAFGGAQNPTRTVQAMPLLLVAAAGLGTPPRQVVVAGQPGAADTRALLQTVRGRFLPGRVVLLADGGEGQRFLAQQLLYLENVGPVDGHAAAYLCENGACQLPTTDPATLAKRL